MEGISLCRPHLYCCRRIFRSKREHRSTLKRMTSESQLDSPTRFEFDRSGAQSKVSGKPEYLVFQTRLSDFDRFDGNRTTLHPSDVWAREGENRG
jgi:hypothetical protein